MVVDLITREPLVLQNDVPGTALVKVARRIWWRVIELTERG